MMMIEVSNRQQVDRRSHVAGRTYDVMPCKTLHDAQRWGGSKVNKQMITKDISHIKMTRVLGCAIAVPSVGPVKKRAAVVLS
eukprot:5499094-Pyramimonas_sp.AAC.1